MPAGKREQQKHLPRKIILALVDYDGCVGASAPEEIKAKSQALNQLLLSKAEAYSEAGFSPVVIFCSGSARQDKASDDASQNLNGNGSSAGFLRVLKKSFSRMSHSRVESLYSPMLLSDLYADLPLGTSYQRMGDPSYTGEHARYLFDEHKVTMIFSFTHLAFAIARELSVQFDPETASVDCEFFDDRDDILRILTKEFTPSVGGQVFWLPPNTQLFLRHYDSGCFVSGGYTAVLQGEKTGVHLAEISDVKRKLLAFINRCRAVAGMRVPLTSLDSFDALGIQRIFWAVTPRIAENIVAQRKAFLDACVELKDGNWPGQTVFQYNNVQGPVLSEKAKETTYKAGMDQLRRFAGLFKPAKNSANDKAQTACSSAGKI